MTEPVDVQPVDEAEEDLARSEWLAARLDKPMSALGVLFLFVVLGQTIAQEGTVLTWLSVIGWVLWFVFAAEFAFRAYVAKDQKRFWRRNWWQLVFLAVPFLRFLRALQALRWLRFTRVARVTRVSSVLSSAIRGSRSAGKMLSGRVAWLAVVTAVVVLATSQLIYTLGEYTSYADALHDAAMSTVTGAPLEGESGFTQILEVVLAVYSVAVFATLAGALGAYFLQPRDEPAAPAETIVEPTVTGSSSRPADG